MQEVRELRKLRKLRKEIETIFKFHDTYRNMVQSLNETQKNYIEIINLYNSSYELMKERYTELSKFVEKYA